MFRLQNLVKWRFSHDFSWDSNPLERLGRLIPLEPSSKLGGFFIANFFEKLIKYLHRKGAKDAENLLCVLSVLAVGFINHKGHQVLHKGHRVVFCFVHFAPSQCALWLNKKCAVLVC